MRQHPIPHNILDIEFKLFGKFSAKQFGYIAIGAVTGGIFLLLRSNGAIPDIIAWPAFLLFSGLGAFFGVVPINDQGSDTIVMNFINAINRPTRRVWKNAQFNQKLEVIAKEREIEITRGSLNRAGQDQTQASIIGSGPAVDSVAQFETSEVIESLDSEEAEKLDHIAQLAQQVQSVAPAPIQETASVQAPAPHQAPAQTQGILITSDTANSLPTPQTNIQTQPNIPYVQYLDTLNNPIPQTLVLIKKENGTVVQAHQTNPEGLIIPSRPLDRGNYIVEIQGGEYNLPSIKFVADDKAVKPIQIKAR